MDEEKLFFAARYRFDGNYDDEIQRKVSAEVMSLFEQRKVQDFSSFRDDVSAFKEMLDKESVERERSGFKTRFISIAKLSRILPECSVAIKEVLTMRNIDAFVFRTNYDSMINIDYIESFLDSFCLQDHFYLQLLPFAKEPAYITKEDFGEFLLNVFIPLCKKITSNAEYYAAYVSGVVFFLLDARRKVEIPIQDLLASNLLVSIYECIMFDNAETDAYPNKDIFLLTHFDYVLKEFRALDADKSGLLSVHELLLFREGTYNQIFLKRIFDVSQTYPSETKTFELDFRGFVDLIAAIQYRNSRASVKFHFEIFDLKSDGQIDREEIREFCLYLHECFQDRDSAPSVEYFVDEVFDMLKSTESISLEELVSNEMRGVFTGVLTNYDDYRKYDGREN